MTTKSINYRALYETSRREALLHAASPPDVTPDMLHEMGSNATMVHWHADQAKHISAARESGRNLMRALTQLMDAQFSNPQFKAWDDDTFLLYSLTKNHIEHADMHLNIGLANALHAQDFSHGLVK